MSEKVHKVNNNLPTINTSANWFTKLEQHFILDCRESINSANKWIAVIYFNERQHSIVKGLPDFVMKCVFAGFVYEIVSFLYISISR